MTSAQHVNWLGSFLALRRQSFFLAQLLEGHDIFKVRDEAYGVGAAVEAARANHADVAHGIAWWEKYWFKYECLETDALQQRIKDHADVAHCIT